MNVYWYEGVCKNCGKVVRGRILNNDKIIVDLAMGDDGWFDSEEKCNNPKPEILEIIDCD